MVYRASKSCDEDQLVSAFQFTFKVDRFIISNIIKTENEVNANYCHLFISFINWVIKGGLVYIYISS